MRRDAIAGAIVAALAVPQSLGYASIAGVPVQVGLYAVPIALLAYAAFGTSPQLIVGPVSTVSVLSASLVAALRPANVQEAVTFTSAIALAAGLVLVIAGLVRVGWVAEFLSKPIVTGFVLGLTVLVIVGELPNLLGIPVPPGDVLTRISVLVRANPTRRGHVPAGTFVAPRERVQQARLRIRPSATTSDWGSAAADPIPRSVSE